MECIAPTRALARSPAMRYSLVSPFLERRPRRLPASPMTEPIAAEPFPCARFIKEIGRGPHGARALSAQDTYSLYSAMLAGRVSDLELGAVLLAYRLKGETADELVAMLAAAQASISPIRVAGPVSAVSIP